MNPKSTLNNNAITLNDLFYEWKDLLYYIHTHNESSLLEKQEGKIHLCILYTSYYWLTSNFKVLPLHFALLSKFFLPPFTTILVTHGGSRQLPFLLNVYHKVTYNVQNWAWTLLLLYSFMLNMYLACHITYILYWMWSQIYYVNVVKNTPFFWQYFVITNCYQII